MADLYAPALGCHGLNSNRYFTRMAEHNQAGRDKEFKVDLTTGLRVIALVSVISSAVLIVLSYPVARVFVGEYPSTAASETS